MTLSYLMKGHPQAVERLACCSRAEVYVPQPVLAEIAYGLERLPPSQRRQRLEGRFQLLAGELRRLEWTDEVSRRFGAIKAQLERAGRPLEDFDIAIAAHALACNGILVTGNLQHMGRIAGLELESWD